MINGILAVHNNISFFLMLYAWVIINYKQTRTQKLIRVGTRSGRDYSRLINILKKAGEVHDIKPQLKMLHLLRLRYQTIKEIHSRDITISIVSLWFNIVNYSSLFQYFLSIYHDPYSN